MSEVQKVIRARPRGNQASQGRQVGREQLAGCEVRKEVRPQQTSTGIGQEGGQGTE
jgi:hypothetical protein